ncbi:MAG: BtpA/SgcQ family protein [Myxococcota bacterium]
MSRTGAATATAVAVENGSRGARSARLVGVIHLPPLPGSPRHGRHGCPSSWEDLAARVQADAACLATAGFDGMMVENFGDAPFYPGRVPAVTVAAVTRCALVAREAAPGLALGINVLRNDVAAALAVAAAVGDVAMVRCNVHVGARVTDQGVVEGQAHETLRRRRRLGVEATALWCDVDVKHSRPLGEQPLSREAQTRETVGRGLADAVLVTGNATGAPPDAEDVAEVVRAAGNASVYIASGVAPEDLFATFNRRDDEGRGVHGVVVGSWLRADARAGGPIDLTRAKRFAEAFRRAKP